MMPIKEVLECIGSGALGAILIRKFMDSMNSSEFPYELLLLFIATVILLAGIFAPT